MSLAPRIDKLDKNAIINGNFDFWQRVVGNSSQMLLSNNQGSFFTADRAFSQASALGGGTLNYSVARSTNVPTLAQSGFQSSYSYQVSNNAIANFMTTNSGNYLIPYSYRMEGLDYARLHGKKVNWSFWFQSNLVGTYTFAIRGSTYVRSYVTTFNVTAVNTWQQVIIPIQMESTGAYTFDSSIGIEVLIGCLAGTGGTASTLNAWTNDGAFVAPGATNWSANNGAIFRIAQVCATDINNVPTTATSLFSRASNTIAGEFELCLRYYEKSYPAEVVPGTFDGLGVITATWGDGSGNHYHTEPFRVVKRSIPSVQVYNGSTGGPTTWNVVSASFNGGASVNRNPQTTQCVYQGFSYNTNLAARAWFHWAADAEL